MVGGPLAGLNRLGGAGEIDQDRIGLIDGIADWVGERFAPTAALDRPRP